MAAPGGDGGCDVGGGRGSVWERGRWRRWRRLTIADSGPMIQLLSRLIKRCWVGGQAQQSSELSSISQECFLSLWPLLDLVVSCCFPPWEGHALSALSSLSEDIFPCSSPWQLAGRPVLKAVREREAELKSRQFHSGLVFL